MKNILTKFDRGKKFSTKLGRRNFPKRRFSTEEKRFDQVRPSENVSTEFNQGFFSNEKIFDR